MIKNKPEEWQVIKKKKKKKEFTQTANLDLTAALVAKD